MCFCFMCFAVPFTDGSLGNERPDGFSNVVNNASTGVIIGGSCSGGMVLLCVFIYTSSTDCGGLIRGSPLN